ncbi:MAG: hypothetical protein ACTH2O_07865 [Cellulosimicrobium funkei]
MLVHDVLLVRHEVLGRAVEVAVRGEVGDGVRGLRTARRAVVHDDPHRHRGTGHAADDGRVPLGQDPHRVERGRVEPVAEHTEYYRERLERFEKLADLA